MTKAALFLLLLFMTTREVDKGEKNYFTKVQQSISCPAAHLSLLDSASKTKKVSSQRDVA